jgi:hypothetical protein
MWSACGARQCAVVCIACGALGHVQWTRVSLARPCLISSCNSLNTVIKEENVTLFLAAPNISLSVSLFTHIAIAFCLPPAHCCGYRPTSGIKAKIQEGGGDTCIMGTVTHGLTHSSISQPSGVSITTAKRVPSTREARHRRVGRQGSVGKCSVPNGDEDQLQRVVLVDEGSTCKHKGCGTPSSRRKKT